MSVTTYSELITSITSMSHRDGDDDFIAQIPVFFRFGELRVSRDLRIRAMESSLDDTIADGVVAVPSGYVSMKYAYIDGSPVQKLERKDAEWIHFNYPDRSGSGSPKYFARDGSNFIFGPYPTDGDTMKGTYYWRLPALSTDNETNWFTENAPDLLLFAALIEAEPYLMNDQRAALWEQKYAQTAARIQREDEVEEFSGSPLSSTVR